MAQFDNLMSTRGGIPEGYELAIGRYFSVRFPDNWPEEERYEFSTGEWHQMKDEDDPFQNFRYT